LLFKWIVKQILQEYFFLFSSNTAGHALCGSFDSNQDEDIFSTSAPSELIITSPFFAKAESVEHTFDRNSSPVKRKTSN